MKVEITPRGFMLIKFEDSYMNSCSLQKSSAAMQDCIWFGLNKSKLTVFENSSHGKYVTCEMPDNFSVDTRMHLTREQVAELLPYLVRFVETGDLFAE